ncbi:hypothetical protein QAD02_017548 [Eretmocerus hayati]|uniref:Uncharacterized protein n=1 Tax=Eretmocerus hayati TaxID=131215 RepID=A0ACC2PE59_9HYME|nr:hypothetical protein QAD02_017548 [Eretmocerus hayati]
MKKLPDKYIRGEAERVKGLQEWLTGKRIKREKLAERWEDIVIEGLGYTDAVIIQPEEKLAILDMIGDPLNFTKTPLLLLIGPAAFGYALWKKAPVAVHEKLPHVSIAQARNAFVTIVGHQPTDPEVATFWNCMHPKAVKDYCSFYMEISLELEWADVVKAVNLARESKDRMTVKKPSVGRANRKRSARELDYDPTQLQPMELIGKVYVLEGGFKVGTVLAKRTLSEELLGISVALARAYEGEMREELNGSEDEDRLYAQANIVESTSADIDRFPKRRGASRRLVQDFQAYEEAYLSRGPINPVKFYGAREWRIMQNMGSYTATVERELIESTYVTDRHILEKMNRRGHEHYHMHEIQTLLVRCEEEGYLTKHKGHIWLVNYEKFSEIKDCLFDNEALFHLLRHQVPENEGRVGGPAFFSLRQDFAVQVMRRTFDIGEEIPKLRGNLKRPRLSFPDYVV